MKLQDQKFAQKIREWLDSNDRSDMALLEGARMVLQLNRNKNMYMAACRKPSAMQAKIERELKKHLAYYNDGLTLAEVEKMTEEVIADVKPAIEEEKKVVATEEPETMATVADSRRGKRKDHDALHASVRQLWDKNAERWKKIKEEYNTCLLLDAPCDRYEHLKILKELWYAYKKDMARYDDAKPEDIIGEDPDAPSSEVKSARPYISKNLPTLERLTADKSDDAKRQRMVQNIQKRVNILLSSGEVIKDETIARLAKVGIDV